jgi:hypothetical protein
MDILSNDTGDQLFFGDIINMWHGRYCCVFCVVCSVFKDWVLFWD